MTVEEGIATIVLAQPNSLASLIGVLDELPVGLSAWFTGIIRNSRRSVDYTEVDIVTYINMRLGVLPADIIVRSKRDPVPGDIVEMCLLGDNQSYINGFVKVTKVNMRDGTVSIQNITDPENVSVILIQNVMCVMECIDFDSLRWHQIIDALLIDYDSALYQSYVESIIEQVKESEDFEGKDEIMEVLENRLTQLSNIENEEEKVDGVNEGDGASEGEISDVE